MLPYFYLLKKLGKLSKHLSCQKRASCTTVRQEFPSFLHPYLSKICSTNYLKPKSTLQFTSIQAVIIFNIKKYNHDNIHLFPISYWNLPLSNLIVGTCLFPTSCWNLPPSLYQSFLTIHSSINGGIMYLQGFCKNLA